VAVDDNDERELASGAAAVGQGCDFASDSSKLGSCSASGSAVPSPCCKVPSPHLNPSNLPYAHPVSSPPYAMIWHEKCSVDPVKSLGRRLGLCSERLGMAEFLGLACGMLRRCFVREASACSSLLF